MNSRRHRIAVPALACECSNARDAGWATLSGLRPHRNYRLHCRSQFPEPPPRPFAVHQHRVAVRESNQLSRDEHAIDATNTTVGCECGGLPGRPRSEEHTSELQSLMRNSYAVFCLKKTQKKHTRNQKN